MNEIHALMDLDHPNVALWAASLRACFFFFFFFFFFAEGARGGSCGFVWLAASHSPCTQDKSEVPWYLAGPL